MRKRYFIPALLFAISFRVFAQSDPDWVDMEIELKQHFLKDRRRMAKEMALSNRSDYDIGYYGLALTIDILNENIYGNTTIRGTSKVNNLQYISLDFVSSMQVDSVGRNCQSFQRSDDNLAVCLSTPIDSGAVFEIQIAYYGHPPEGGFQGFSFDYHNGVPIVSTLSEPYYAHSWFPCKDLPGDKADSADISITVPDTLIAISNGTLESVTYNSDSTATYLWQERYPIAVYLISLAVSNYEKQEYRYTGLDGTQMPVNHWYYPEAKSQTGNLPLTTAMISFFAGLWGEYPFIKEKYGHAQFSWGGGMEHQTCTSLGGFGELLICHELAHQWWGDMITCANWKNIWLNEGFARYAEALWKEHKDGAEALKKYMNDINRLEIWQISPLYITDTTSVSSIFNRLVYDKGAWVLHMLRHIVGEEIFWDIFPAYRDAFYMDVVTTEDFQDICEIVSGIDLDWFFEQWIYQIGQPEYTVNWSREAVKGNEWRVTLNIDQTQSPQNLFKMPLDIRVEFTEWDTLFTVWDSLFAQQFVMQFDDMPTNIEIDPAGWVLKSVVYSMIDPDLGYIPDSFLLTDPYPNPFNGTTNFRIYLPYNINGAIKVYDVRGRVVDVIEQGYFRLGYYRKSWQPQNLPSGVYVIRLETDVVNIGGKVVYIK
ncbi:MAG TPA: peptidase M1 [Candidatus Marinimicrobia bacterium]|nr:peptidase M1 [Candidatus Neomarinimicrobiota bacterium]